MAWTGVNAINLTVQYEPAAITAEFRVTTATYDANTDPDQPRAGLGELTGATVGRVWMARVIQRRQPRRGGSWAMR